MYACTILTNKQPTNNKNDKTNKEAGYECHDAENNHNHSSNHNANQVENHIRQHKTSFLL